MSEFANLERLVNPRRIAIIGASPRETSQGRRLLDNLVEYSDFGGEVLLVNPAYEAIGTRRCWPSVEALPAGDIDIALVIVNASLVLDALRQCAARQIPFAIVMTSGFAEAGEEGKALEQQIRELCARTSLRVYGPNCPGFVNVRDRLGMTFSPAFKDDLNAGSIGVATQGGGLGRNILQGLSFGDGVGLWFSAGNEADLDVPDFIAHMARDPAIRVIAVLMEGVKDGRRLAHALSLAREHGKPVVVLKIGRSELGIRAAQSHTASIAGSAAVNSAAFRQFGAIEVDDLDELVAVARMLAAPARKDQGGLCIVTFSGGTAALAADIVGAHGLPLAELSEDTRTALKELLPAFASIANPVDTTADILRNAELTTQCLRLICSDPNVDTVLFPIPMDYAGITAAMATTLIETAASAQAMLVPVWMSRRMGDGFQRLEQGGMAPFLSLTAAINALKKAGRARRAANSPAAAHASTHAPTHASAAARSKPLSEVDGKRLLREHGIAVPSGQLAQSAGQAVAFARELGFPVVMKVVSEQILHKTEAGGVRLGINSEEQAREAFAVIRQTVAQRRPDAVIDGILVETMLPAGGREMLIGVHRDEAFGPVLTVGLGGIFVEVLKDVAHRVIPITPADAHDMLREIRYFQLLEGVRGQAPADIAALEALLVRVSDFAEQHRDTLLELDLNPVWVGARGEGAIPLDALIVMRDAGTPS
ncbi:acetate--CoA ligase family protein [Cupriavidus necator]